MSKTRKKVSSPTISGEGVLTIKSSNLVRSKEALRQIRALKSIKLAVSNEKNEELVG
mgnify:CR=1 FL=1